MHLFGIVIENLEIGGFTKLCIGKITVVILSDKKKYLHKDHYISVFKICVDCIIFFYWSCTKAICLETVRKFDFTMLFILFSTTGQIKCLVFRICNNLPVLHPRLLQRDCPCNFFPLIHFYLVVFVKYVFFSKCLHKSSITDYFP